MKKKYSVKAKQFLAAAAISAALGLSVTAQDRGGYITSTGRGGYITSTGRADTDTITAQEALAEPTDDGTGTMGSGGLTVSENDKDVFSTFLDWIKNVLR